MKEYTYSSDQSDGLSQLDSLFTQLREQAQKGAKWAVSVVGVDSRLTVTLDMELPPKPVKPNKSK